STRRALHLIFSQTATIRACETLLGVSLLSLDVRNSMAYGGHLLGIFIRNIDIKFLFKCHNQLDDVEGVGAEVVLKGCLIRNLLLVYAELLGYQFFHFLSYGHCCLRCLSVSCLHYIPAMAPDSQKYRATQEI